MFNTLVSHLEPLLITYGVFGLFLASVTEEIIAPLPSTLVVFTSSVILTRGLQGMDAVTIIALKVMIPASLGMAVGSLVPYSLARVGEKVAIDRFGKYLGINWAMIERIQKWAENSHSDEWIIFLARAIPGCPSLAVSIVAGLARIPVLEFFFFSLLGALPRTFALGLLGWWGGKKFTSIIAMLNNTEDGITIIVLAVIASVLTFLLLSHQKKKIKAS